MGRGISQLEVAVTYDEDHRQEVKDQRPILLNERSVDRADTAHAHKLHDGQHGHGQGTEIEIHELGELVVAAGQGMRRYPVVIISWVHY